MSTYSKRIKIDRNVLLEYVFDNTNYKTDDYTVLTNLKEETKSYLSESSINNVENSLFLIDPILSKYSPVNTNTFNFLRLQRYFTAPILNDKLRIYFPSGFEFQQNESIGFFINVYTYGYDNKTKYSLTNFYYTIDNINTIDTFTFPTPFYFDEQLYVKYVEIEYPSINSISEDRIINNNVNIPTIDSINQNLTYSEGLSTNSPIFIDFAFITSKQVVMETPYYFLGDLNSVTLPQTPEFTDLGVNIEESNQGDFFEICSTYMGSNQNMDEFEMKQNIKGVKIRLEYIVSLYEENILSSRQTFQVNEDLTQKILYRPIVKISNTTAAIDVELRVVNLLDNSYISKFGSIGIINNINKYGLKLTRLNINDSIITTKLYNMKVKNTLTSGVSADSFVDVMKVPYPVMVDRYRILAKSISASNKTDYVSNGLLEILVTPFDNVIEFNLAQGIDSNDDIIPYDLSSVSTNSNLKLVFKSDSEKLEKLPFYEAENNYELGHVFYKLQEKDYKILRRIYNSGFDNFYLVVGTDSTNTQLYSGKFLFYEDVTFIKEQIDPEIANEFLENKKGDVSKKPSLEKKPSLGIKRDSDIKTSKRIKENNPFAKENMDKYDKNEESNKNFINAMVYVRHQINIDKMDKYLESIGIVPHIKYGNVYYFKRIYKTTLLDIKNQDFIEKVFEIPLFSGEIPENTQSPPTDNIQIFTKDNGQINTDDNDTDNRDDNFLNPDGQSEHNF